nr:hypothetical protein [Tanacetum cinerariifolium]
SELMLLGITYYCWVNVNAVKVLVSAMAKTTNKEAQLHARIDGKKIIITEASIRRDLQLADEEGDSLVRDATTNSSLEAEQDSGNINKTQSKETPNESSSQRTDSGGGPRCQEAMRDTTTKLELYTNLQTRVLDLEKTKTTQSNKIASLKRRVKKLEKWNRSRTHKLKRLYKVGLTARVESSIDEESLGEDASKQGRIKAIDTDEDITLVNIQDNAKMFDVNNLGEPMKPKKKDQIRLDEEAAKRLQAQFDEEERLLKLKEFDEIQETFDKAFRRVNTFEDFRTELVERKEKRAGEELIQVCTKKKKVDDDKEKVELKQLLETIPDEEEVAIDAIPLAVKSLKIVDWKIHKEGKKSYYQIMRADEKSQMYMFFSQRLKSFDKEDLKDLYKLVKARYGSTRLVDKMDYLLWSDIKLMFEPHVQDEVWKRQQGYKVLEWKLYDSCGIHSLRMQSIIKEVFGSILLVLIKLLMKKLNDFEKEYQVKGRIVGIKSILDAVGITAAHA